MINYVTPTLLNNWLYTTTHENADLEDFMRCLRHEQTPITLAMQEGIKFENGVYNGLESEYIPYLKNAVFQVEVKGKCQGIGIKGIIDILTFNRIYDVKHTKRYEVGKYSNGTQHIIYPYCTGIYDFTYLVNKECYKEDYHYIQGQCEQLISNWLQWLKDTGNEQVWRDNWILKG